MAFEFNDPLLYELRAGTQEDPYIDKIDSRLIVNNNIVLDELPDSFNGVIINGYTEVRKIIDLTATNFFVNYLNGIITFTSSENSKTVVANYKGRGVIQMPSSRSYYTNGVGDVVGTIQSLIDTSAKSITFHTTTPLSSDGEDGDIWFVYNA